MPHFLLKQRLLAPSPPPHLLPRRFFFSRLGVRSGESFFFPISWRNVDGGHAMILELEKEPDSQMLIRPVTTLSPECILKLT